MRHILNPQLQLGETNIEDIQFDPYSRDDIPQILRGLQYIYTNPEICGEVFKHLERIVPEETDASNGRVWCKYSNEPYDIVIRQYYG